MHEEFDGFVQLYHPNGKLSLEGHYVKTVPDGVIRTWHSNGQSEYEMVFVQGKEHGVFRQWARDGRLLGTYEMTHGTGHSYRWRQDGSLSSECDKWNGRYHGRFRVYYDEGDIDTYYINGREVSRKKYMEALETDSTLPRYDDLDVHRMTALEKAIEQQFKEWKVRQRIREREGVAPKFTAEEIDDELKLMVVSPNSRRAREWIEEPIDGPDERSFGKLYSNQNSRELLDEGFGVGAVAIHAVGIKVDHRDGVTEYADQLVVSLPSSKRKRKKVFEWCARKIITHGGGDPPDDVGQSYVYIFLD